MIVRTKCLNEVINGTTKQGKRHRKEKEMELLGAFTYFTAWPIIDLGTI